jgi:multicomponent Na+:H+ antiporter subunit B
LIIDMLLTLMAILVLAMAVQRNLFAVVVLAGIYSFLMATVYLTKGEEAKPVHKAGLPLLVSIGVAGALVYGTLGLPAFSDAQAPIHTHVVPRYLNESLKVTGVPNVVTSVLASWRGYDTLGETTVVFTAGAGVVALLRRRRRDEAAR